MNDEEQKIKPCAAPKLNDFVIQNIVNDIGDKRLKKVKVLDLGTGEGYNLYKLKEKLEELKVNYEFIAVDINEENFKLKETENIKFINTDLNNDFDFGKENFDFVIATEVIEHLENPYKFIENSVKHLKIGGIFYCSSPNVINIYSALKIILLGYPMYFGFDEKMDHIMPTFPFMIKYALKKIERKINYEFDLKVYYSCNILKIPKLYRKNKGLTIGFYLPGRNRFLGEISIYKISRTR